MNAPRLDDVRAEHARRSFWHFRKFMHPRLKESWWQRDMAEHLEQFRTDLVDGRRPILLAQAPPQHGKSVQIVDFIAWLAGHNSDLKTIYASFSERLGVRANLALQRIYTSPRYQLTFPETVIGERGDSSLIRNRELLEYRDADGMFRNTTVRGPITGEGLDLGVLDDPIKGREEASSKTVRDNVWDWLTDDFMTRMSDDAGLLGIMTRWHLDDPFGRLKESMPDRVKVLRYPAIAERDESHRRAGEALFPDHKSIEFLLERKAAMHAANFEALYQQNPIVVGGGIFKDEWWQFRDVPPRITSRTIYGDTAQKTKEQNDFSVFECWGAVDGGGIILLDVVRGKWEAPELLERARAFYKSQVSKTGMGKVRALKIEDKVSGTGLIQTLRREGVPVQAIQRSVDKVTRAFDASPHVESGHVMLMRDCPHLSEFLAEASAFPNAAHDDTIDPMMDAVTDMLGGGADTRKVTW